MPQPSKVDHAIDRVRFRRDFAWVALGFGLGGLWFAAFVADQWSRTPSQRAVLVIVLAIGANRKGKIVLGKGTAGSDCPRLQAVVSE